MPGNVPMAAVPAMPQPPKPDNNLFKVVTSHDLYKYKAVVFSGVCRFIRQVPLPPPPFPGALTSSALGSLDDSYGDDDEVDEIETIEMEVDSPTDDTSDEQPTASAREKGARVELLLCNAGNSILFELIVRLLQVQNEAQIARKRQR